jgi:dephospho-CoA kinase
MKVIGITGGVGCGKSTVLDLIADNFNAYVIKADEVGRHILAKGEEGYQKVVAEFGAGILDADYEIDRRKLAQLVFNDRHKLERLNSIEHPIIKKLIIDELHAVKAAGEYEFLFVEAALIYEEHYDEFCDEVWFVYANESVRRQRLKQSRSYTDEKISDIIRNQMSEKEFRQKCDRLIDNSGSQELTLAQLKKILVEV